MKNNKLYSFLTNPFLYFCGLIVGAGALVGVHWNRKEELLSQAYKIADKNKDGFVDGSELAKLAKDLKLLKEDESLIQKDLEERIRYDSSLDSLREYVERNR